MSFPEDLTIGLEPEILHLMENLRKSKTQSTIAQQVVMKRCWHFFKEHRFAKYKQFAETLMTEPKFQLMRMSPAEKMNVRGRYWYPPKHILEMSPRSFFAPAQAFLAVFVHEMCHQAVAQVDQNYSMSEKGHHHVWREWMTGVGQKPSRFDTNDNYTYLSNEEKEADEGLLVSVDAQNRRLADALKAIVSSGNGFSLEGKSKGELIKLQSEKVLRREGRMEANFVFSYADRVKGKLHSRHLGVANFRILNVHTAEEFVDMDMDVLVAEVSRYRNKDVNPYKATWKWSPEIAKSTYCVNEKAVRFLVKNNLLPNSALTTPWV